MKKILLTGAAGSVGNETLKQLINTDYKITVLDIDSKKNRKQLSKFSSQVTIVYGDIRNKDLVGKLVEENDAVIHLAALIPPFSDRNEKLTYDVNFGGTKNVVDAIKENNPSCFLLFSSSVSVYGDRLENYWIKVDDKLKPSDGDYYAKVKIITEEYIKESGIDYTIFRFTGIMNRPQIDPLMFHMPLDTKLEIATVYDTARALIKALEHKDILNHNIYNLAGGETCRIIYHDFLERMFSIYGLQIRYLNKEAFAKQNFHCGYFLDSDELENILHFRNDTLDDYYYKVDKNTNNMIRFSSKVFSKPILYFLNRSSEPLQALKKNDKKLIRRFYGK